MKKDASKNTVLALIVIAVLVSAIGTTLVLKDTISEQSPVKTSAEEVGKVSFYVVDDSESKTATGKVIFEVVNEVG